MPVAALGHMITEGVGSATFPPGGLLPERASRTQGPPSVGGLGEPIRYGSDDILPLLYECGFRWVRSLDFNELALEMLGDYKRDRQFRFQHLALAAVRTPVAGWP